MRADGILAGFLELQSVIRRGPRIGLTTAQTFRDSSWQTHLNQCEDLPARFFGPIQTRDPRNQGSGEKERKKDESTDFKNVEQNWSPLSAREVTNRGWQYHKKVNNRVLAARVSYADRMRFPETNPGCNRDYGAVANHELGAFGNSG